MSMGLVSIIMPAYNAAGTIKESIQSVLSQTYKDWELLVIDDGSTDQTAEIVQEVADGDVRVKLMLNRVNMGVVASRNRGLAEASGDYIAFLDSDDLWKPKKLERQLGYMEEKKAVLSYGACEVTNGKVRYVPETLEFRHALYGNVMPCLTVMIHKVKWQEKYPNCKIEFPDIRHEDYALWLKMLQTGEVAYGIQEPLAIYREGGESLSGNKLRAAAWTYHIFRDYLRMGLLRSAGSFIGYVFHAVLKRA